ncbi:MAG: hypothetical protein ACREUE_09150, partial [Panacagrimonas sp.]
LSGYLPRVWIYPLRGHGPAVILLITAILALGSTGLVALVPLIVGVLWTAHYAVRVIERTSLGRATPPRLTGEALMLADGFTWSTLFLPGVLIALYLSQARVALGILLLALPAHWIALATTRSLVAACHPLRLLHIAAVTGPAYLAVCALLAGSALLGKWLGGHMASLLLIAAWLYLLFAACHLLGFVAYLRHERIGFGVEVRRPSRTDELETEQAHTLDTLVQAIRTLHAIPDDAAAARLMLSTLPGQADARRFHEDLYERIKAIPARGLALTQAARLISFLLDRKLADRALEIFENAMDLDPRFRVESSLQLAPLADRALMNRQRALIDRLLDNARSQFADDPAIRLLDRVRVRALFEIDRNEDAARAALIAIGDISGHPHAADLRTYERILSGGTRSPPVQAGPDRSGPPPDP